MASHPHPSQRSSSSGVRKAGLTRLLAGISTGAAALALSLAPGVVRAATAGGAVNGTPTVQFGVGSITRTPTLDTVTVNARDALIDWASNDPDVYLAQARTLQFNGTIGAAYTVLNRVDAAGPLQINGTVASDAAGRVWFYNPGGWVVGSTGVFNVGSLLLTSNPVAVTATAPDGQRFIDGSGAIHLTQGLPGASVTVQPGGQITAPGNGSYVALVAPRVVQGGTVTTNGATAYVGAEAATITVNNAINGMFDIIVDSGTSDANGVVHTGTTNGPAATSGGPAHQIAMVAVPKNQLLTMLVSGNLGYTAADTAQGQVDGTIVLGAGYNVRNGAVGTNTVATTGGSARLSALNTTNDTRVATTDSLTVDATGSNLVFAKSFLGSAFNAINFNADGLGHGVSTGTDLILSEFTNSPSRSITLAASNGGTISVGRKTDLFNAAGPGGTGAVAINARTGGAITLGGDLAIASSTTIDLGVADAGSRLQIGGGVALRSTNSSISQAVGTRGGAITLSASGGASFAIARTLDVRVDATGGVTLDPANSAQLLPGSVGVAATAGSITFTNTDATVSVGGSTRLQALGLGGIGAVSAGAGAGGSISFIQSGAGASSQFGIASGNGFLALQSLGDSAAQVMFPPAFPATGAASSSGPVTLSVTGGRFDAGSLLLNSDATTSFGQDSAPYRATAGAVAVTFANGSYSTDGLNVSNTARDSNGGVVATGKVSLTLDNATLTADSLFASTLTQGTVQTPGGLAVKLQNGSTLNASSSIQLTSTAQASGLGPARSADLALQLSGSTLSASGIFVSSSAFGGDISPDATAGLASVALDSGSKLTATNGSLVIESQGVGTSFSQSVTNGGVGTGGTAQLNVSNSVVNVAGSVALSAQGVTGLRPTATGRSGAGQGGTASIVVDGSSSALTATDIQLDAPGRTFSSEGRVTQPGGGTPGTGGSSQFTVSNGAQVSATSLTLTATGTGGDAVNVAGSPPATGGAGTGGNATLTIGGSGSLLTTPTVTIDTSGYGGAGADADFAIAVAAGNGGIGRGGNSSVNLFGGTLETNSLSVIAGGNQSKSFDYFTQTFAAGGTVGDQGVGTGGIGGAGFGGISTLNIAGGALVDLAEGSTGGQIPLSASVSAIGEGGPGGGTFSGDGDPSTQGAGGAGTGGTAQLFYDAGVFDAQSIMLDATGRGGLGGKEFSSSAIVANAGAGGAGQGGSALFEFSSDFSSLTSAEDQRSLSITADGVGANGSEGIIGSAGGQGSGGFASFEINRATTLTSLNVSANGVGGLGGDSQLANVGANGGTGSGGTAQVVVGNGEVATLSGYTISAQGFGGAGGTGGSGSGNLAAVGNGGLGGNAFGGTAIVEADGGSSVTLIQTETDVGARPAFGTMALDFNPSVDGQLIANATGGAGGSGGDAGRFGFPQRGNGAKGGDASGGSIQFVATGGSTIDLGDGNYSISTTGGDGGEVFGGGSGTPSSSLGGAGGRADFGEIVLRATDQDSTIKANSLNLNAFADGGYGGDGYGTNPTTGNGTPGAAGGDASSARITLLADFGGSITVAPGGAVNLSAVATGGNGGDASAALDGSGGAGGRGGDGGSAFDSAVNIQTGTDATISFGQQATAFINATGVGGRSGDGGAGASNPATGGDGGNGGDAGNSGGGNGGAISLVANGGTITTGDLELAAMGLTPFGFSSGQGGIGGAGGPGATIPPETMGQPPVIIPPGANGGNGGSGFFGPVGGTVAITAADDGNGEGGLQFGTVSLGNVNAKVTSQAQDGDFQFTVFSGSIALTDTTNSAGTGLFAQSFSIDATGSSDISPVAVTLSSVNHPVTVADSFVVDADGSINLSGQDGGGLVAGDTIQLNSNRDINLESVNAGTFSAPTINLDAGGNIRLSSADCPTASCVVAHADNDFSARTFGGQFILSGPARAEGLGSVSVTAAADIRGDRGSGYLSNNNVTLLGGGSVEVRNVRASSLTVDAGASNTEGGVQYSAGTLTVGEDDGAGTITTDNAQVYRSGGSIRVPGANTLSAGLAITFASANDISVGQNASIAANLSDSDAFGPIVFAAGGILSNTPPSAGDIPSLLIGKGASIDAGVGDVRLLAAAIDARGASFKGTNFTADVTQDLSLTSTQRSDGGQLSAPCLEADICLGAISASGAVRIGSSETVPLHVLGTDAIAGGSVDIFSQGSLTIGSGGQITTVTSPGAIGLTSYQGNVVLTGGAGLTGGSVSISAGGSLLGNGRITATSNDIGISVGGDIVADTLTARQLTGPGSIGDPIEPRFTTPGNFTVNTLNFTTDTAITGGGDVAVGQANLAGRALSLTASGATSIQSTSGITNLTLTGATVDFGTIDASGFIATNGAGGVTGGRASAGTTFTGSGSSIAIREIASGSDTTLNGGAMTLGTIGAVGNLAVTATGPVSLDRGTAGRAIAVTADSLTAPLLTAGGNVTLLVKNAVTLGTVKAGGNILIDPTVVSFTALTSGGSTAIVAGDVLGGTIDAGTSITIDATGRVVLDRANAGTTLSIGAATLAAPALTSGGAMALNSSGASTFGTVSAGGGLAITARTTRFSALKSTGGAVSITGGDVSGGTIAAATALSVASTAAIALDSATSGAGMTLTGSTITAPALTSGSAMTLNSSGASTLGTVSSGAGLQIAAKPLTYASIVAAGPIAIMASAVNGGAITSSGGALAITSPGTVSTGALASGTDTTISADALTFASINAAGSATLSASSVSGNPISARQDVSVTSGTALAFQTISAGRNATLIANTGNVTVSSDFAVGGTALVAGDAVTLTAKGPLSIGTVVARGGDVSVTAGGALGVSDGQAIGNIALTAQQGALTLGRLAAGSRPTSTFGNVNGGSTTATRGPGNITLSAPGGITATGTIDSAAALTATTNGAISLGALTAGNTIALTSSDLVIGATAQLGQARTSALTLTSNGSGGMVLGDGFDTLGGYLVSNAEFARIHSGGSLTIDAGTGQATGTAARLTVGTLSATAASGTTEGNVASDGTLTLRSGNGVAVLGAATFGNAAANTLAITAAGDLMIDAARGSLRLIEGNGHGGTLALNASRVLAVTPQALTDISAATTTGAITTRLSASDGVTAGATLLEAGALRVSVARGFYVQNTAPLTGFDDRRGLVSDSLAVIASGTAPITIVANGLINGQSGLTAIPLLATTGSIDPQSSLNGCVILAVATCNQPVGFTNPIQDVIGSVLGGALGAQINSIPLIGDGFFNTPLMTLNQIAPVGFVPLIDEPVTGTGNDDLAGELTSVRGPIVSSKKKTRKRGAAQDADEKR